MEKISQSLIIPTRNRSETALAAIASALDAPYPNLQIVVSDNSDDDLLYKELKSRDWLGNLTYHKTESVLSMRDNWERGLDTLAARVWPTDHDTAPAGTKRRRRCQLRSALDTIGRLDHWDVLWEAGVGGAHKAVIRRGEGRAVRDMTRPAEASALVRVRGSMDLPVSTRCARPSTNDVCSLFRT